MFNMHYDLPEIIELLEDDTKNPKVPLDSGDNLLLNNNSVSK